jgi:saccharopine dehydrogenase-like NADP-dependent oxidoreductase
MKVLILGAAGRAGRAVLGALRFLPGVEAVFLADNDAEGLTRMASQPAPFPLHLRYLEAADPRSLRERLSEADLALGCLGPFHLHEVEVFRAVLETGRDYLTLCDDARITAVLLSRREEAAACGSRVLLGCGMAPGLSNLLALRAASLLDRVDRLGFFWRLEGLSSLGWATLRHFAHSLSGRAVIVRGGREERVRAGGGRRRWTFPRPPVPPSSPTCTGRSRSPSPAS